ncbi:hypothetical protein CQ065_06865 [Pseudomonas sp. MYb187]|uniref:hypothetical protein n=1 Tax=Pseudomonas TaxID=286 RepID=UPI000CFDB9BF|nr:MULTISPECIES: hypothetical protein [unclassified Pseudomonas]MCW2272400.1 hypothetical protein [Pseudomonas sp. JUb96]PRA69298.1 hypothetical protein CQ065_06865 [Pseudomonas sp. MYb187]
MNIDKAKLHPLLWAVVGAWKTGDQGLQLHTDALDQFLGEHTVEQVALQLLAELDLADEARDAYAADKKSLAFALNDARAEAEALRKDAERYRFVRNPIGTSSPLAIWNEGKMPLFSGIADAVVDEFMTREASHG